MFISKINEIYQIIYYSNNELLKKYTKNNIKVKKIYIYIYLLFLLKYTIIIYYKNNTFNLNLNSYGCSSFSLKIINK